MQNYRENPKSCTNELFKCSAMTLVNLTFWFKTIYFLWQAHNLSFQLLFLLWTEFCTFLTNYDDILHYFGCWSVYLCLLQNKNTNLTSYGEIFSALSTLLENYESNSYIEREGATEIFGGGAITYYTTYFVGYGSAWTGWGCGKGGNCYLLLLRSPLSFSMTSIMTALLC